MVINLFGGMVYLIKNKNEKVLFDFFYIVRMWR